MQFFQAADHPPRPVDVEHFTGAATVAHVQGLCAQPPVNLYRVTFQPSARTAWHSHTGVQVLLVIEGCCRVQKAGAPIQDVVAGGVVRIEPGERHWHGATPDSAMTHIALNFNATTAWFEKVSDREYAATP